MSNVLQSKEYKTTVLIQRIARYVGLASGLSALFFGPAVMLLGNFNDQFGVNGLGFLLGSLSTIFWLIVLGFVGMSVAFIFRAKATRLLKESVVNNG